MPIQEGLPKTLSMNLSDSNVPSTLRNAWSSTTKMYATGDISYDEMAARITAAFENPSFGIRKAWLTTLIRSQDQSRATQRSISVERLGVLRGDEDAAVRERANTYLNLMGDEGANLYRWWHQLHPDEPFPAF